MALYNWNLESDVNRIFDDFIKDLNVTRRGGTRSNRVNNTFVPLMDVHETDDEFLFNTELPGLNKDQINVDVRDNTLTISGETKKDKKYEKGSTHIQERSYGSFSRSISLPPNVKADDITAKFENGLLELKLPKTAPSGKKITIQ
ncbi:HSP20-like chaperone [Rhizophagus irregularis]|uniref:HSP20-like chaperone n=3 Tax=Rhizophagus irregularis TaxID=588596 RepID=A0A2I1F4X7_9GLOM|nr:HSP20-like chaperone [Rhizophagus irregularis DAOM 181602=DAOM 197198]EXX65990.1 Hsp42p [Rhizophagus irregularis DAOM 197198w]PKC06863.1 HSP20-like chaperone [Rhizophagus irregularis]PKC58146.1 HSP20-like chaperone [Rhizophagus irregularis]PKK64130.1 HSP20-like chaperone [Rhizophagus irregularis]PKY29430.1 HSP20-like chaperone [Rhizophagus irregularis]|eukprot:XP_025170942.1 HSP20-like chaperone [Rhizophagus irregularis DAOM 181602=DAOM 197198]